MKIAEFLAGLSPDALTFDLKTRIIRGKERPIAAPSPGLYELQQRFAHHLEQKRLVFPNATCVRGESAFRHVLRHCDSSFFYLLDLKDAFPSIESGQLADVLLPIDSEMGSRAELVEFLEQYFLIPERGLAQGGPASQLLFNIYCEAKIDAPIRKLLEEGYCRKQHTIVYSRYVDDLAFSSGQPFPRALRRRFRRIIEDAGFTIHDGKVELLSLANNVVEITGVRILPGGLSPSESFLHKFNVLLNQWLLRIATEETFTQNEMQVLHGLVGHFLSFRQLSRYHDRRLRHLDGKISTIQTYLHKLQPRRKSDEKPKKFSPQFLDELRSKVSLGEQVEKFVKLKWVRKGREARGLCPFHNEKTASFTVAEDKGFYHCFGCGAHGDVIGFVSRHRKTTFTETVEYLAKERGLSLPP